MIIRRRWRSLAFLAAVATLASVAWAVLGNQSVDRRAYIQQNRALLRTVPAFPGAHLVNVEDSGYKGGEYAGAPTIGYGTTRDYTVATSVQPERVIAFYHRALGPRWRLLQSYPQAGYDLGNFRDGNAYLEVSAKPGQIEVTIDHDCYKGGPSPACFGP